MDSSTMSKKLFTSMGFILLVHSFSSIECKRAKCKVDDMVLAYGDFWVNKETCDIYYCLDDMSRYGEVVKYKCVHTVLRLYPKLTKACRDEECLPKFTWVNPFIETTESATATS